MLRVIALALALVLATACEDQTVPTPSLPGPSSSSGGSGTDGDGWGDPSTTRREGTLRLAHLNLRRYFDATCDSGKCEAGDFEDVATAAEFEARTAQLASGLARLQADVITLAEIENQGCIDALQAKLSDDGYDYPVAHVAALDLPGSMNVGVLARGSLDAVKAHRKDTELTRPDGTTTRFARELPEYHLTVGSTPVVVFAAHFRSKFEDDAGRRLAEAAATRDLVVAAGEANTGALVLLGGDLNDVPGSAALEALEKDAALVRVAKDLPIAEQGTFVFEGERHAIDHIYTTAARATAYVPKSAKVVRDGNGGFAGSDHASIYADFTLP